MAVSEPLNLDRYPMRQGGGAFLACVGAAILWGSFHQSHSVIALEAGATIGLLATAVVSLAVRQARRRAGLPGATPWQVGLLVLAIAIEGMVFAILYPLLPPDDHLRFFAALTIVAAHFVLMTWSFGPSIAFLALALLVWLAATYWLPGIALPTVLAGDCALKLVFGLAMLIGVGGGR